MSLDDLDFIKHIRDEAAFIIKHTGGKSRDEIFDDEVLIKALVNSIGNIGEASGKTSEEFRNKYPAIPWRAIRNTRNIIIHHYFGIDYDALWNIISNDIPELIEQVNNILEK